MAAQAEMKEQETAARKGLEDGAVEAPELKEVVIALVLKPLPESGKKMKGRAADGPSPARQPSSAVEDEALEAQAEAPPRPERQLQRARPKDVASAWGVAQPAQPDAGGAISRVQSFILRTGGVVSSIEYDKATNLPSCLTAKIPSETYADLLKVLRELGTLAEPPSTSIHAAANKPIQVKIEFK